MLEVRTPSVAACGFVCPRRQSQDQLDAVRRFLTALICMAALTGILVLASRDPASALPSAREAAASAPAPKRPPPRAQANASIDRRAPVASRLAE